MPALAGAGARFQHLSALESRVAIPPLLEFHTENLFDLSPDAQARIDRLRERCEFSLHCVGLSLGSADGVDQDHIEKVRRAVDRYQPLLFSDHVCWNRIGGVSVPDLLPLPFEKSALNTLASNISHVQDTLHRRASIENLSYYLRYESSSMGEAQFLSELCARTGCGVLLDINNLEINRRNFGIDPDAFLQSLRPNDVDEYHLAGGEQTSNGWIDTHSRQVDDSTWTLFRKSLEVIGPRHTIVEWDQDIPELNVLLEQTARAASHLGRSSLAEVMA
ncbi:MAG: DUF692 domain-containing protein [Lysobacter sp.]|nr:DUF692 domain-containing protein [Lysobacter sp.]